ncbi:alpha/beta hydrolase-fold protein [Brucepastera parasyntrophica]|uniref:alpha/beta hydrolase-fold protein n=1 Tax=Brucepastera parasyntrophica TaxID=2880008 RepID=UPI003F6FADD1
MGGVMSLYMALSRPDLFGYAMIFSPALHLFTDKAMDTFIREKLAQALPSYPRFFLYSGGTYNWPEAYVPYNETLIKNFPEKMYEALASHGYPETHIRVHVDKSKEHSESAWAEYFPIAYSWLIADSHNPA